MKIQHSRCGMRSSLVATASLLIALLVSSVETLFAQGFIRGDVATGTQCSVRHAGGDGEINLADSSFLGEFLNLGGAPPECMDAADFNADGVVDNLYVVALQTFAAGSGTPPPAPWPDCGIDLTDEVFMVQFPGEPAVPWTGDDYGLQCGFGGTAIVDTAGGEVRSQNGLVTLTMPVDAAFEPTRFSIGPARGEFQLTTEQGIANALFGISISLDARTGPVFCGATEFSGGELKICWNDADNDGIVDGTEIAESTLQVFEGFFGNRLVATCLNDPGAVPDCTRFLGPDCASCDTEANCLSFPFFSPSEFALAVIAPPGGAQSPGDVNQDRSYNIADAVAALNLLFGTPSPLPCGDGSIEDPANQAILDFNGDGSVNIADAVASLNRLFALGDPHALGVDCTVVVDCPEECAG